jgi:hypothetical protein
LLSVLLLVSEEDLFFTESFASFVTHCFADAHVKEPMALTTYFVPDSGPVRKDHFGPLIVPHGVLGANAAFVVVAVSAAATRDRSDANRNLRRLCINLSLPTTRLHQIVRTMLRVRGATDKVRGPEFSGSQRRFLAMIGNP